MAQTDDNGLFSIGNLGLTAVFLMMAATLFGLKSGGTESDKSGEKQTGEKAGSAILLPALATSEAPHRAFIFNYLRGRSVEPAATPLVMARAPQVSEPGVKRLVSSLGLPATDPLANAVMLSFSPPFAPGHWFTKTEAENVDILIATVPDPIDTAFGFWYDDIIESLIRAIGDTDQYAPAGQWSPWEQYQLDASRTDVKTQEGSPRGALFEHFPGVLLFRGRDKPERVLVVLLVSETANSVRSEALKRALNLAKEVQQARNTDEKIRLIAPSFTGSQPSLLRALREWAESNDKTARFEVISGSAGGLAEFKDEPGDPKRLWERQAVTLHATVIPSTTLQNAAIGFLKRTGNSAGDVVPRPDSTDTGNSSEHADPSSNFFAGVALLVESNTGFGRAVQNKLKSDQQWPMYLTYPMHISHLQTAYAKKRRELEKRIGLSGVWTERNPQERSVRPNADTITSLDDAVTAPINDRVVDDITTTIRRNQVRFVGIVASDPQDKVFFVQRIKKACPNVDIFITSMELLYTLPENQQSMRGVIVATTYPLHPPNQWWIEPKEPRRQAFKSQCGQGYYNAAGFHLAKVRRGSDDKRKPLKDFPQEYAPPVFAEHKAEPTKPPVWIMVIGEKGRLVPLAFFNPDDTDIKNGDGSNLVALAPPPTNEVQIDIPPLGQFRALALLVLVILVPTLALFLRRPKWVFFGSLLRNRQGVQPPKSALAKEQSQGIKQWWTTRMAQMNEEEQRVSVYHNLILSCFTISLTPILSISCILLTSSFTMVPLQSACLYAIVASLGIVWAAILFMQFRLVGRFVRSQRLDSWNWYVRLLTHCVLSLGSFVFGILLLVPLLFTSGAHVASRVLFVDRSTGMSTGYSVLPPALFMSAAFLIHTYFALKRDYLGQRFKVECPYPSLQGKQAQASPVAQVFQEIHQLNEEVRQDLTDFAGFRWRHRHLVLTGVAAFVPAALLVGARAHVTWEGRTWDVLFLTGSLCLAALVLVTLMRFLAGWRGLERILKLIATVPMVRAFDRLPRKTATLFGGYLFARRPRVSHLAIPSHILRQLQPEASEQTSAEVPSPADEPVLTAVKTDSAPANQPSDEDTVFAAQRDSNSVQSRMPRYDEIPVAIAQRLLGFDYMSEKPAEQEAAADREYPSEEINKLSAEARRLIRDLEPYWPRHTVADAFGEQPTAGESEKKGGDKADAMPPWVEKAEDFVAIQAIIFLSQHFILLRTMALSLVWVSVFLLLAATIYPFQPEQLILYLLLGLLGCVVGVVFWVLVRVNKNEIVGRITRSTPNRFELNGAFFQAAVRFIGPIAIIVAAQLSGRLRAIVEPLLEVIK